MWGGDGFSLIVLIETLWNVKEEAIQAVEGYAGINRNIVECKGKKKKEGVSSWYVLIETLWNVK